MLNSFNSFMNFFFYTLLTVSPCLHTRLSRLLERFLGLHPHPCRGVSMLRLLIWQHFRGSGTMALTSQLTKPQNGTISAFFPFSSGWNCSRSRWWWRFLIGFLVKVDLWRAKDDDSGHNNLYLFFFMSCELSIIILISHRQVTDKCLWCAHVGA